MAVRRPAAALTALLLATTWGAVVAAPAVAACHIAAFVEPEVEGSEATGAIAVIVELQGGVASCAGTVDVATVDGTATAGLDYDAVTTTLTFVEGDDRVETVDLVLLDDDEAEGAETFTVVLSNPTGSISGTGDPAVVVIADDEQDDSGTGDAATDEDGVEATTDLVFEPVDESPNTLVIIVIALAVIGGAAFMGRRGRR